jgi:hypothetical protein
MNPDLIFEILDLAVSLAQTQSTGTVQQDATVAGTLVQIVRKASQAYRQHTGETLDSSLIEPEEPL